MSEPDGANGWRSPGVILSIVALAVTLVAILIGPIVTALVNREESVRSERRTEYATFLGTLQRCGVNAEDVIRESADAAAANLQPIIDALKQNQPLTADQQAAAGQAELAFRSNALKETSECSADLGRSVAVIGMLAGIDDVAPRAGKAMDTALSYRRAAADVGATLLEDLISLPDHAAGAGASTGQQSTPSTAAPEPKSYDCGKPTNSAPIDDCADEFYAAFDSFQSAARDDAGPSAWWFVATNPYILGVAVVMIAVNVSFSLSARRRRGERATATIAGAGPSPMPSDVPDTS